MYFKNEMTEFMTKKILGQWYDRDFAILNLQADGFGDMDEDDRYIGLVTVGISWKIKDGHIYVYSNSGTNVIMILEYEESSDTLLDITKPSREPYVYTRDKRLYLTKDDMLDAVMGLVVGDALGVPVEFESRESLKRDPVVGMREYGTHNQPAGTWSDDSSMTLATVDWYNDSDLDYSSYEKLMQRFCKWRYGEEFTPHGKVFDIGIATSRALYLFESGREAALCGGMGEYDNGNGSLMRILPASLMEYNSCEFDSEKYVNRIFEISAVTHGHIRSKLGCLIYSYILIYILNGWTPNKTEIIRQAVLKLQEVIKRLDIKIPDDEYHQYDRVWNCDELISSSEDSIKSSGYIVDTLEAAIWCFANTDGYKDCVLKAVNLGGDTDTVGAVAGGLAGLYYGIDKIPKEWVDALPRRELIEKLIDEMDIY